VDATLKLPGVVEMFAEEVRPSAPRPPGAGATARPPEEAEVAPPATPAEAEAPPSGPTRKQLLDAFYAKAIRYPGGLVAFLRDHAPWALTSDEKAFDNLAARDDQIADLTILLDEKLGARR
ncbi:hypothetical protein LCGC14_1234580, partial [marine sediment metagenome]